MTSGRLSETLSFDGSVLREAIQACFARRGTDWTTQTPLALTSMFYTDTRLNRLWSDYRTSTNPVIPPPDAFDVIGERIFNFLAPIRESVLTGAPFTFQWLPGSQWYWDTGVKWLERIPMLWEVKRLKRLLSRNDGGVWGQDSDNDGVIVLRSTEQTVDGEWRIEAPALRRITTSEFEACRLIEGDLVVTKSSGSARHIGKTSIVTREVEALNCCFSNFMQRFRTNESLNSRFAWYVLNSELTRNQFNLNSGTTTGLANLNGELMGMVILACPPIPVQRAIVSFLDRETAKIGALVAKKERLIELLDEKRRALITHAVTKGIDPLARMKNSGVESLGKIPAQWEVKRLWHVTAIGRPVMYGIVLPGPDVHEGVPIVKGGDVSSEQLRPEELSKTTRSIETHHARSRLRTGDLVYAIRGSIGDVTMIPPQLNGANLTQDAARVSYTLSTCGPWLLHTLRSMGVFHQLSSGSLGATIRGINVRDLKRALIPVPPIAEQRAIASFVEHETDRIDTLVAKVYEAIEWLKELRVALIAASTTGKVDVGNPV